MIKARGISKIYKDGTPLADVDLDLERGRILAIAGTNGSGRTMLLRVLATQLKPTRGRVEIDGMNAIKHPFRVRPKIGFVPQSQSFYDYMTVGEFLKFVTYCHNESDRKQDPEIPENQPFDGLETEMPLRSLSFGLRQKLALTSVLVHKPPLLLLDEPLTHLDPIAVIQFHALVKEYRAGGGTVVMACNRASDIAALCDQVAFMHRGRILRRMQLERPDIDIYGILKELVENEDGEHTGIGSETGVQS